ncbi:hypothetical protein EVAR_50187_1 [Eumeta japonica]|uniref:Uncharacterized protein n=1 Tax=Eumeta variegata TaxID=151549 RepID=A0A4C1WXZ6_EUMVA|nr:hypothetical protein EVAR_50187_1 [Eumeta japonica]
MTKNRNAGEKERRIRERDTCAVYHSQPIQSGRVSIIENIEVPTSKESEAPHLLRRRKVVSLVRNKIRNLDARMKTFIDITIKSTELPARRRTRPRRRTCGPTVNLS